MYTHHPIHLVLLPLDPPSQIPRLLHQLLILVLFHLEATLALDTDERHLATTGRRWGSHERDSQVPNFWWGIAGSSGWWCYSGGGRNINRAMQRKEGG